MKAKQFLCSSAAMAAIVWTMPVYAQIDVADSAATASADDAQEDGQSGSPRATDGSDIVVTGTRLRSGLVAPTPVIVTSAEQITATAPSLISEALNQLPVFKGSGRSSTSYSSPSRDNGSSFLNLRGLGKERTLVLLDGRRFVSSSTAGVPDINLFPQDLVQRVEVVTGGASAVYGSYAVAGVVNLILDKTYEGVSLGASAGVSTYGDGAYRKLSATGGTRFGAGGNVIASFEYFKSDRIGYENGRRPLESYAGLAPTGQASPSRQISENVLWSISPGGLISTGPLAGQHFLPGGGLAPFNFGTNRTSLMQVGGDGAGLPFDLAAGIERYTGYGRAQYELGDVTVYGEISYAQTLSSYNFQHHQAGITATSYTIFAENAFLSDSVRQQLGATPSFQMKRISRDFGYISSDSRSRTFRAIGGFDWKIGTDWEVNGYYMHGENRLRVRIIDTPIIRNLYAAVDAVRDPASGQIVCRSQLSGLDPNCVPLNLFGDGSPSAEALGYILGTSQSDLTIKEDVASLGIRGSIPGLPAGDINLAAGVEYRREAAVQKDDAGTTGQVDAAGVRGIPLGLTLGVPGIYHFSTTQPLKGSYDIKEGYIEAEVPLLKDVPGFYSLSVNGAVRLIDYSTVGNVTTWKVGASWEPFADLRFRATRSRDIRAANINELFSAPFPTAQSVVYNGNTVGIQGVREGNENLAPEKADTLTAGVIFRPSFIPGLGLSIDYYDISLKGAIQQLTYQQTVDQCAAGSSVACSNITTDASGQLVIRTPFLNLSSLKTEGLDFEASYDAPLGAGRLYIRGLANRLINLTTQVPGAPPVDRAGDISLSGTPKWTGSLFVSYKQGGFELIAQERYIGPGRLDTTFAPGVLGPDDRIADVFYTDITVRQRIETGSGTLELFGTVNNLFNKLPPLAPAIPLGTYRATNASLYDTMGRYFSVGARIKF